jgi:6-phosphogluconolactonase
MQELHTQLGTVRILPLEDIPAALFQEFESLPDDPSRTFRIGLTGGSTPKTFYQWASHEPGFGEVLNRTSSFIWGCSDERHVDLESEESNFGNAQRMLLDPLGAEEASYRPWPVYCKPEEAAERYNRLWEEEMPDHPVFDLCLLGMGDDCHTASLFPGSPLLDVEIGEPFAAIEVPGKGWRLTITPTGLRNCPRIVVSVTGAGKTEAVKQVFQGEVDVKLRPIQLLAAMPAKVLWLMDEEAAKGVA